MSSNVYFLGVARVAEKAIVVASYSYNTETNLSAVKQVLDQPNMTLYPGKHYSFSVGQMAWHLIADDIGLMYILICNLSYPQRCSHACLEELQRNFTSKTGESATAARDQEMSKTCGPIMQKLCQKYDNLTEVDKLATVSQKIESVKLVMQENIDLTLQNCVKLETIERAAEELQQQAGIFKRSAHDLKNKMWWKNLKMKLVIALIILVVLGIIIGVIAYSVKKK